MSFPTLKSFLLSNTEVSNILFPRDRDKLSIGIGFVPEFTFRIEKSFNEGLSIRNRQEYFISTKTLHFFTLSPSVTSQVLLAPGDSYYLIYILIWIYDKNTISNPPIWSCAGLSNACMQSPVGL